MDRDTVYRGPFAPMSLIGGSGGSDFTTCGWAQGSGALAVKGFDVWFNSSKLRGIQVTYSDDSRSPVFGAPDETHSSIIFAPGELVTSFTLWGNGVGTRTGRIRLTTNKGQTFDAGKDTSGQTAYDINIGSGLLVGMIGRSGDDIDQLGAVFVRSAVVHVSISDVKYDPDLAGTDTGISEVALATAYFSNPPDATAPKTWNFSNSIARTTSTTYSQTTGNTFQLSASVEVSGEPFGIGAKATAGFQWQHQSSVTTSTTTSTQITLQWSESGQLQPGQGINCTAVVQQGQGRTNYDATVVVKLEDGTTNTFKERGVFNNIAYTKVSVTTEDVDPKNGQPVSEAVFLEAVEN